MTSSKEESSKEESSKTPSETSSKESSSENKNENEDPWAEYLTGANCKYCKKPVMISGIWVQIGKPAKYCNGACNIIVEFH